MAASSGGFTGSLQGSKCFPLACNKLLTKIKKNNFFNSHKGNQPIIAHCQERFIMPHDLHCLLLNRLMELGVKETVADGKLKTFLEGRRDVQKHMVRVSNLAVFWLFASLQIFLKKPFITLGYTLSPGAQGRGRILVHGARGGKAQDLAEHCPL